MQVKLMIMETLSLQSYSMLYQDVHRGLYEKNRNLSDYRIRALERQFVNSVIEFWKNNFIPQLLQFHDRQSFEQSIQNITVYIRSDLENRLETHIKKVLRLGLIEGYDSATKISNSIIEETYQKFMHESVIGDVVQKVAEEMKLKMMELKQLPLFTVENQLSASKFKIELEEAIKSIAYQELNRVKNAIRSEVQYAVSLGRELAWRQRDPDNKFRYRWGIGNDDHVTDCCRAINERVNQEAEKNNEPGVTLDRLIQIVKEEGSRFFPDFRQRKFNPHYGCRSGPERTQIRRF